MSLAGSGFALPGLNYEDLLGLYYLRDVAKSERQEQLIEAFTIAISRAIWGQRGSQ